MIYLTPEERRKRSGSLGRDQQTQAEIRKIDKPKPPPRRDRQAQATTITLNGMHFVFFN
jgi:hypothetical protein